MTSSVFESKIEELKFQFVNALKWIGIRCGCDIENLNRIRARATSIVNNLHYEETGLYADIAKAASTLIYLLNSLRNGESPAQRVYELRSTLEKIGNTLKKFPPDQLDEVAQSFK